MQGQGKSITLGISAALMCILGYPGGNVVEGNLGTREFDWSTAMVPFLYILYELLVGLADATQLETEPKVKDLSLHAQISTGLSWLTYPVVYVFPMLGFSGANAIVAWPFRWNMASLTSFEEWRWPLHLSHHIDDHPRLPW